VLQSVEELTGAADSAALSVRGDVEVIDDKFVLKLVWQTPSTHGERVMQASSCDELARAAALVVALASTPSAQPPATDATRAPSSVPARSAPVPPPPPVAPLPTAKREQDMGPSAAGASSESPPPEPAQRASAQALFLLDSGSLPAVAVGGALAIRVPWKRFAAGAEVAMLSPQQHETGAKGGRFWAGALALRPCLRFTWSRISLLPCAVLDVELVVARGVGVDVTQGGTVWFPRFGAGAEAGYSLGHRLHWVGAAWVLVAPLLPSFVVNDTIPVYAPARTVGRLTTGLLLDL
jgi:hypothetical protein